MEKAKGAAQAQTAAGRPADAVEEAVRRRISQEELQTVVEAHRQWVQTEGNEGTRAELERCDLSGLDVRLDGVVLRQASLRESNLGGVSLQQADLRGADLQGADLATAGLWQANLQGADLRGARFCRDFLRAAHNWALALYSPDALELLGLAPDHGVRVQERNFRGLDLQGANLVDANLQGFHLCEARLDNANLSSADLEEAKLREAALCGAKLSGSHLQDADLTRADLRRADLTGAALEGTKLREADLQDANLSGAIGLQAWQLAGSNVSNAQLPEGQVLIFL